MSIDNFPPHLTRSQKRRLHRAQLTEKLQVALVVTVGIILLICASTDNLFFGQITVVAFIIGALLLHTETVKIFRLALLLLVAIPVTTALYPYSIAPENMAVFAFLLLLVGVGFALIDLISEQPSRKSHKQQPKS
ncbi:MAG: hypothetical protein WBP26_00235 [Candidatus Saccharimonadales bacterium]